MIIRRLSNDTVGRIAAGEVIERPAAAVKELLENAIDAAARRIDISVVDGGVGVIEVRDDGTGIGTDELALAVERHATSKIESLADLDSLQTLGFRGEALASLGAVSAILLRSRQQSSDVGAELSVSFGEIGVPKAIAWGTGTSVLARDLFENLPARRKFLRQAATEAGYISRVVSAYALAYPSISFSLEIDGRVSFTTDGRGNRIAAGLAVWGAEIAGQLAEIELVDGEHEGYSVTGVVSVPTLDRATRQQQFTFAQGRLVASRQIATAFEQAYHSLIMVGRHPLGCLLISVPPDRIDVNVHPTKSEVRFADERLVFSLVQRAVREMLVAYTPTQPIPTIFTAPLGDQQVQRRLALSHPEDFERRQAIGPIASDQSNDQSLGVAGVANPGGRAMPVLRVLGQLAGSYVIAEGPDGMYLIDQHAAHERILFERIFSGVTSREPDRQMLLDPAVVELEPGSWNLCVSCKDELESFGFELEEFGARSIVIRAVPAALKIRDPARTLVVMLDEIAAGGRGDTRRESLAISAACHNSIRAGQALSLLEMRELIIQLEQCSSPRACGHGRPTMLRMTVDELERQFARR